MKHLLLIFLQCSSVVLGLSLQKGDDQDLIFQIDHSANDDKKELISHDNSLISRMSLANEPFHNSELLETLNNFFNDLEHFMDDHNYSLPVPDMIRSYGYVCEQHLYETEDGYVNVLHRIPPTPTVQAKNQSLFVQHGLLGTSADFVMGSPQKSLGYLLADAGYDVWLGNARGNAYSRNHANLSVDSDEYWKFSFDEMGRYDLPAAFKYVLKHQHPGSTDKLVYIGHSMGTTMFWVSMNERQQFVKESVRAMIALGPVAKVTHVRSPISLLAPYVHEIQLLFDWLGVREFAPTNKMVQLFDEYACDSTMRQLKICENLVFLLAGYDDAQMNMTMLPIILGHEPGGTSTRTVIHFAQLIDSNKFQKFDHGDKDNMRFYNQTTPPEYSLDKVDIPVALLWSDNDWLADPKDVTVLFDLPNVVENYEVPNKDFNHIDFLWGLDADQLVFKKIFQILEQQTP